MSIPPNKGPNVSPKKNPKLKELLMNVDALVDGTETHVKRCAVIKPEKAQEVVDYLNSAEAEDGSKLKVTL